MKLQITFSFTESLGVSFPFVVTAQKLHRYAATTDFSKLLRHCGRSLPFISKRFLSSFLFENDNVLFKS